MSGADKVNASTRQDVEFFAKRPTSFVHLDVIHINEEVACEAFPCAMSGTDPGVTQTRRRTGLWREKC